MVLVRDPTAVQHYSLQTIMQQDDSATKCIGLCNTEWTVIALRKSGVT